MSSLHWITPALQASVVLSVFTIGLGATSADATYLLRHPRELLRSLAALQLVMPVVALLLVVAFDLHQAVATALVALSLSPAAPLFPHKALKAGGTRRFTIGLLVSVALVTVVLLPAAAWISARYFGASLNVPVLTAFRIVSVTILAPLTVGIVARSIAPSLAERIARPMSIVSNLAIATLAIILLVASGRFVLSLIGNGTIAVLILFALAAVMTGHALGGPRPQQRTVLVLANALRHPGVALAFAAANIGQSGLLIGAVLLYLLAAALVTGGYLAWLSSEARGLQPSNVRR